MTIEPSVQLRLRFLARVVRKQCKHLAETSQRLFGQGFSLQQAVVLEDTPELAERVEAFVGRFSRLQDTLGDKVLPLLLFALGEKTSAVIDNLDRAERLGIVQSADDWLAMRNLRDQMIHEYVEDAILLHGALVSGNDFVPALITAGERMISEITRRGWE